MARGFYDPSRLGWVSEPFGLSKKRMGFVVVESYALYKTRGD